MAAFRTVFPSSAPSTLAHCIPPRNPRLLQEFDGRWVVEPGGSGDAPVTTLRYEISLVPKLSIPSAALVHVVRSGLPANIKAIARRAEEV